MENIILIISKWKNKPGGKPDYMIDVKGGETFSGGMVRGENFSLENIAAEIKKVLGGLAKNLTNSGCVIKIDIHFETEYSIKGNAHYSMKENWGMKFTSMNDSVWLKMPLLEKEILLFHEAFEFLRSYTNVQSLTY